MAQDAKTLLKLHFDKYGKGNLIRYESERFGEQNWQARVILPDGRQFSGDIKGSKKESEKLAAQTALDAIQNEPTETPSAASNPLQINWKGRLQEFLKQSVTYATAKNAEGMFVSQVTVNGKEYASDPLKSIKEAEQQVAETVFKKLNKSASLKSMPGIILQDTDDDPSNWKGLLQELIAKNKWPVTPVWNYSEHGLEHNRYWQCSLDINGLAFKSGQIKQQKDAAKHAAKKAVEVLQVLAYSPALKNKYFHEAKANLDKYVAANNYAMKYEEQPQLMNNGLELWKVTANVIDANNRIKARATSFTTCTKMEDAKMEAIYLVQSSLGKAHIDVIGNVLTSMKIEKNLTVKNSPPRAEIIELDSDSKTNSGVKQSLASTPTARPNIINPKNMPRFEQKSAVEEPSKKPKASVPQQQDPDEDEDEEIVYKGAVS